MVLGHEGVGVVESVGPDVKVLKKGDRIGWGYETNSCGTCNECLTGTETFCDARELYGFANADQGSFASHAIWREAFLHKIPEGLTDAAAAPLVRTRNFFYYSTTAPRAHVHATSTSPSRQDVRPDEVLTFNAKAMCWGNDFHNPPGC